MGFGRCRLNQSGMTLVEVLVAIGIMSIFVAVMTQMQVNQMKEMKALNEKLAVLDFEKLLIGSLADGSTCLHVLNTPTPTTFNSTALPDTPQVITPTNPLYARVVNGVPGPVVARVGDQVAADLNSVIIRSIQLRIVAGSGSSFTGQWEIDFDQSRMVRPLKAIQISTALTADITNPTAARITSCMGNGSTPSAPTRIVTRTYTAWRWGAGAADCDADEEMVTGGGTCTAWNGGTFLINSSPTANGWYIGCDTPSHYDTTATVYAVCRKR